MRARKVFARSWCSPAASREDGPEGEARQAELLGICRETGMRLVGPNCLGVLNTAPGGADGRHVRAGSSAARAASRSLRRAAPTG